MVPTELIEKYFFKINELGIPPQDAVDATEAAIAAITHGRAGNQSQQSR